MMMNVVEEYQHREEYEGNTGEYGKEDTVEHVGEVFPLQSASGKYRLVTVATVSWGTVSQRYSERKERER